MNEQVSSSHGTQLAMEGKGPSVGPFMLQIGKQLREGESPAQSHTASECQGQSRTPGMLMAPPFIKQSINIY